MTWVVWAVLAAVAWLLAGLWYWTIVRNPEREIIVRYGEEPTGEEWWRAIK